MKNTYNKFFLMLSLAIMSTGTIRPVVLQQSGIVLTVKNLLSTGAIENQGLSITQQYCGYKGIQPVEFIVKNNSDVPVRISAQSLKATRVPQEQLIIKNWYADAAAIMFLTECSLGLFMFMIEACAREDNYRAWVPVYVNGRQYPSFFPVTIGWSVLAATVITLACWHSNRGNAKQLKKLMLADEVVIQPGQTVRKIAFFDAQYYNGLFTFHVLSDDKKRYVANFDVELFD